MRIELNWTELNRSVNCKYCACRPSGTRRKPRPRKACRERQPPMSLESACSFWTRTSAKKGWQLMIFWRSLPAPVAGNVLLSTIRLDRDAKSWRMHAWRVWPGKVACIWGTCPCVYTCLQCMTQCLRAHASQIHLYVCSASSCERGW